MKKKTNKERVFNSIILGNTFWVVYSHGKPCMRKYKVVKKSRHDYGRLCTLHIKTPTCDFYNSHGPYEYWFVNKKKATAKLISSLKTHRKKNFKLFKEYNKIIIAFNKEDAKLTKRIEKLESELVAE